MMMSKPYIWLHAAFLVLIFLTRANALFNAVKKQYGLNTFLLQLKLPSPPPPPVPVPASLPRLPSVQKQDGIPTSKLQLSPDPVVSPPLENGTTRPPSAICMCDSDIQETARFVREFVTTSLIPWMEKCVVEWNEAVSF